MEINKEAKCKKCFQRGNFSVRRSFTNKPEFKCNFCGNVFSKGSTGGNYLIQSKGN